MNRLSGSALGQVVNDRADNQIAGVFIINISDFAGVGQPRRNKATVKYEITLDDNVVFPERIRAKHDVNHLTATVYTEKDFSHKWGVGTLNNEACDVYGYSKDFVLIFSYQKPLGQKVEIHQEARTIAFSEIASVEEKSSKGFIVKFNNGDKLTITSWSDAAHAATKKSIMKE